MKMDMFELKSAHALLNRLNILCGRLYDIPFDVLKHIHYFHKKLFYNYFCLNYKFNL